jgi:hypothetical protein
MFPDCSLIVPFRLSAVQDDMDGLTAIELTDTAHTHETPSPPHGDPPPFAVEDLVLIEADAKSGDKLSDGKKGVFRTLAVVYERGGGKLYVKADPHRTAKGALLTKVGGVGGRVRVTAVCSLTTHKREFHALHSMQEMPGMVRMALLRPGYHLMFKTQPLLAEDKALLAVRRWQQGGKINGPQAAAVLKMCELRHGVGLIQGNPIDNK